MQAVKHIFFQHSPKWTAGLMLLMTGLLSYFLVYYEHQKLLLPTAFLIIGCFWVAHAGGKAYWQALFPLLVGYAFSGKGFSYIRVGPLFIGEIVLGIGLLAFLTSLHHEDVIRRIYKALQKPEIIILATMMIWGLIRTLPNLPLYGANALRDAVIWGYATFALLIIFLFPANYQDKFIKYFQFLIPIWLIWMLITLILRVVWQFDILLLGIPVGLLDFRAADMGMYLAAISAFLLLHLDGYLRHKTPNWLTWLTWLLWLINFGFVFAQSRGSLLSILPGLFLPVLIFRRISWFPLFTLLISALIIFILFNPTLNLPGLKREVSLRQFQLNLASTINNNNNNNNNNNDNFGELSGTINWRLSWWKNIVNGITTPKKFLGGEGFGVNLAIKYHSQPNQQDTAFGVLRSPHNIFISFLGFSGWLGVLLWCMFLIMLAIRLLKLVFLKTPINPYIPRLALWYLVFIFSFVIKGTLGNLIETPFSGIWFWVVVGFGLLFSYTVPKLEQSLQ